MSGPRDMGTAALRALVCLDLTNLEDDCDADAVRDLCRRAQTPEGSTAAVCVWPRFAELARDELDRTGIRVATVVNFPSGDATIEEVVEETRAALAAGADEIDMVAPYRLLMAGEADAVTEMTRAVKAACSDATLKVILETGVLKDPPLIAVASERALAGGADFLKTSTGKVAVNATPEAARVMLEAIRRSGRSAGFKAAGGVRSVEDAAVYLDLADEIMGAGWAGPKHFRIGASSLLGALLGSLGADGDDAADDDY